MSKNFGCYKCGKFFAQSAHLQKHLNRKFSCDKKIDVDGKDKNCDEIKKGKEKNKFSCDICNKSFTRKCNLEYHKNHSCKFDRNMILNKDDKIKKLEEENLRLKNLESEIIELKKTMDEIKNNNLSKQNITNSLHNNNNNNKNKNTKINSDNINQQNFFLNNYTGNGMPPLTPEQIEPLLKRGFQTPVELTRAIHFNPNFPEYHNIYLPKINEKNAAIFIDGKWQITDRDDIIEDIYEHKRSFVLENLDKYLNKIDETKQKSLKRWLNTVDNEDESIINTKKDIQRLLYNNRHMVMDRKKAIEKAKKNKPLETTVIKKSKNQSKESFSGSDSDSNSDSNSDSDISNYDYDYDYN
jgi:hypothetical protein